MDRNNIKRKIKGSFLSKVLELPPRDFVVYVKKILREKKKIFKKILMIFGINLKQNNDK